MYFVNRSKIEKALDYIDEILHVLDQHTFKTQIEYFGLERMGHLLIEGLIDVGNMMIDGFIMRDPGSYTDIIDILVDQKVIPKEDIHSYLSIIKLREMIVRNYMEIDHGVLRETIVQSKSQLMKFSTHVRTYLDNELGVPHAFFN